MNHNHEVIEQSTLTIQSIYRAYKARKELKILKRQYNESYVLKLSSSTIQLVIDNTVAKLIQERQNSIRILQNSYRRWSANKLALSTRENYLSLRNSVILIQRAVRRYIEHKRIYFCLIQKTADDLVHNILTQSHMIVTKEFVKSVITLQSMYRGVKAHRELSFLRKQYNETILSKYSNSIVERVIMESKLKLEQERLMSVIRIQNCYRRWTANKLAISTRKNYLSLKSTVISLQLSIRIHLEDKKHKYELQLRNLSNALVDRVMYICITIISQEILLSTLSIQRWYRLYSSNKLTISIRNNYISMRKSATSIQRAFRKHRNYKQILKHEKAAVCIQCNFRSYRIRSEYTSRQTAVILIQQTFRKCPVYLKNRQLEKESRAAITIQSFFRGYLTRQNMESSLLSIKRRLSDATKSADISDQLKNKIPKYLDILLHSRSLSQKYDILDNLKTAVYVSEPCAIRVRREGLNILYMLVDNNVRSPSIMQRVEKAADVLLQMTKWPSIANDVFIYGQSIPIITDLLQKIYTTQPSTVRILCHLLIAFCKHPDQVATIHSMHKNSIQKMHKLLTNLKRKYSVGANRMLGKARKDLSLSIHELERVFTHFRYIT
ncbi:Abnormal spindle-like microcephaly-associated protein-like [Oopsacas minuta]|uniref:Abnormal spindle-like microcephaly-associated protein-like n=1 Tax=Oopsacas minuta TaxID=111878 RepID=A0AAV7KM44_9METZ|nr:Abnormal spindle-like microcephaly-associated protein-like [Oopsacas minuta]